MVSSPGFETINVAGSDILEFLVYRMEGRVWEPGVIFTERELRLIDNCRKYAIDDPAGLPGHNLMLIIDKFDGLVGRMASQFKRFVAIFETKKEL